MTDERELPCDRRNTSWVTFNATHPSTVTDGLGSWYLFRIWACWQLAREEEDVTELLRPNWLQEQVARTRHLEVPFWKLMALNLEPAEKKQVAEAYLEEARRSGSSSEVLECEIWLAREKKE